MRAPLLPLLLLCALWTVVMAQGEVKAIKLCGREYIRAIVYTCGGSRWRRILHEQVENGVFNEDQMSLENGSYGPGTKRDLNQALKTICCQVGCRKSDLTFLC